MAVGQAAITSALDVGALDAVEGRLEVRAVDACFQHAQLLRDVLDLHAVLSAAGVGLSTVPQAALLLQLSENAAGTLLAEGQLLRSLPGGLEALECGLLTVAQSAVLLRVVGGLEQAVRLQVWMRLQARLLAAFDSGAVLPPARLSAVLAKWVVAADPRSAEQRRRAAEAAGDVTFRRRDDGLGDLFATGLPAPLLQAVLCRVRARAQAFGAQDERSAGKRRLDAFADLLLGRDRDELRCTDGDATVVPAPAGSGDAAGEAVVRHCGPTCGCRSGTPVPCGADAVVQVPLGAALGTTDELAELVGHGPLHPDQLAQLLLNAPRLRAARVDANGVPVSVDTRTWTPPRGDVAGLQQTLLQLAGAPPGPVQPRHPCDHGHIHPTAAPAGADIPAAAAGGAAGAPSAVAAAAAGMPTDAAAGDDPQVRGGGHPPGAPGPYRLPRWLRRLLQLRAPRCEWPGCGVSALLCDMDHDVAWPAGATCACQCGPLCRRHHRVKQALMTKLRGVGSSVRWTDPTGRSWISPAQHAAPAPAVRPLPAIVPAESHSLSPDALAELLAVADDDPVRFELRAVEPDRDRDRLAEQLLTDDGWGLSLDDPYRWAA